MERVQNEGDAYSPKTVKISGLGTSWVGDCIKITVIHEHENHSLLVFPILSDKKPPSSIYNGLEKSNNACEITANYK